MWKGNKSISKAELSPLVNRIIQSEIRVTTLHIIPSKRIRHEIITVSLHISYFMIQNNDLVIVWKSDVWLSLISGYYYCDKRRISTIHETIYDLWNQGVLVWFKLMKIWRNDKFYQTSSNSFEKYIYFSLLPKNLVFCSQTCCLIEYGYAC